MDEAKLYLQQLFESRQKSMQITPMIESYNTNLASVSNGWKEGKVSWWGGGNTSIFSLTNAMIRHYYKNGQISSITVSDWNIF